MGLKREFLKISLIVTVVIILAINTSSEKMTSYNSNGYDKGGHIDTVASNFINNFSSNYSNIYSNDYGNNYSNNNGYTYENILNSNRTRKHVIGFAIANMTSPYLSSLVEYSNAEAGRLGIEIDLADAKGDVKKQANQISDFIRQRVDAVILIPVDSKSIVSSARKIKEANIPLISLNTRLDDIMSDLIDTYVGVNATEQGEAAAELMVDALGEKGGNIIIIESVENTDTTISGADSFVDRISQAGNINIIDIKSVLGDRLKAKEITRSLIENIPKIDGIYVQDDNLLIGCIEAAKEVNKAHEIKFIGVGGGKEAYNYIKKGELYGIVAKSPQWEGVQAMKCAKDIINNIKVKVWYRDSVNKVTKENIDSFLEQW